MAARVAAVSCRRDGAIFNIMKSRILIAAAAVLGLGIGQTASQVQQLRPTEQRQLNAVNNGQTTRLIEADHFGRYGAGMLRAIMRDGGHTPYEFGISQACARLRRQNKMRRCGLGGQRI